jgi:hypothetical protein
MEKYDFECDQCFDQPLVVWYRLENLKSIFFKLRIIILPRKSKKISNKKSSICMLLPTFGTLANPQL